MAQRVRRPVAPGGARRRGPAAAGVDLLRPRHAADPAFVYCAPRGPHLFQPDDWRDRVLECRPAIVFHATADRAETLENLLDGAQGVGRSRAAVRRAAGRRAAVPRARVTATCCSTRSSRRWTTSGCSTRPAFWADVTAAVEARDAASRSTATHLKAAAEKLQAAREQSTPARCTGSTACSSTRRTSTPRGRSRSRPGCRSRVLGVGRDARATRGAGPGAVRGTEGEVPARSAAGRRSVLRVVPRPRRRAAAARVAVVEPAAGARGGEEAVRRRAGGVRPQDQRVPPATAGWLQHIGFKHAVLISFDGALIPTLRSTAVNWPGPGRQVGRRVHPRAAAGRTTRTRSSTSSTTCTRRLVRTRPRRSRSSTRASRRSTRTATCSRSPNSPRCSAS